jgi:hypothetical protein
MHSLLPLIASALAPGHALPSLLGGCLVSAAWGLKLGAARALLRLKNCLSSLLGFFVTCGTGDAAAGPKSTPSTLAARTGPPRADGGGYELISPSALLPALKHMRPAGLLPLCTMPA